MICLGDHRPSGARDDFSSSSPSQVFLNSAIFVSTPCAIFFPSCSGIYFSSFLDLAKLYHAMRQIAKNELSHSPESTTKNRQLQTKAPTIGALSAKSRSKSGVSRQELLIHAGDSEAWNNDCFLHI